MVGKVKHARQKLHQQAVRVEGISRGLERTPDCGDLLGNMGPPHGDPLKKMGPARGDLPVKGLSSSFPTSVFAGTTISPEALVQTLQLEPPPPADLPLHVKKGQEERKIKPKKEKMKERRERWLNKISSIKLAWEQQAALARRLATPVVGDMQALADALPELSELMGPACAASVSARRNRNRKNRVPVKKKPEPTDFTLMKQSQKRKLLETEMSRFGEAVRSLASQSNPLADIGEQLRKRMRQQDEGHQGPS
ncbi:unnamed protein product [Merluccius merluccius]